MSLSEDLRRRQTTEENEHMIVRVRCPADGMYHILRGTTECPGCTKQLKITEVEGNG